MKKTLIGGAGAVLLLGFLWFVWPTPYELVPVPIRFERGDAPVFAARVNRITGNMRFFVPPEGWVDEVELYRVQHAISDSTTP